VTGSQPGCGKLHDVDEVINGNGLTLRRWKPSDVPELLEIADRSAEHLSAFLPAGAAELRDPERFIDDAQDAWNRGREYAFAVLDADGSVAGQVSLTPEDTAGEIGYWISADHVGRGLATAAVRLLVSSAHEQHPELDRLQIHCDRANTASARVATKAGFRHVESHPVPGPGTDAQSGIEMSWVLDL
jgi:RimJ/RimL family protein N-acetyltransferase